MLKIKIKLGAIRDRRGYGKEKAADLAKVRVPSTCALASPAGSCGAEWVPEPAAAAPLFPPEV